MIPVKEAIISGAWLHCEYTYNDELIQFRLRILSFRKFKLSEVDRPEEIRLIDSSAIFWLMEIEVSNIMKESLSPTFGPDQLILIDQDGFKFNVFHDTHLRLSSNFAKKSRMDRFFSIEIIPKIKAIGTIPFQLPDDDEAVYSISLKKGTISEV
jgi:hypothetical protein